MNIHTWNFYRKQPLVFNNPLHKTYIIAATRRHWHLFFCCCFTSENCLQTNIFKSLDLIIFLRLGYHRSCTNIYRPFFGPKRASWASQTVMSIILMQNHVETLNLCSLYDFVKLYSLLQQAPWIKSGTDKTLATWTLIRGKNVD